MAEVNYADALYMIDRALPILESYRNTIAEMNQSLIENREPDFDLIDWDALVYANNALKSWVTCTEDLDNA